MTNLNNVIIEKPKICFDNLDLKPDEIDMVISHFPCSDGHCSATIAYLYLKEKYPDREITFAKANYNGLPPPDVTGKNVVLFDFAYDLETTRELIAKANKLAIIDHHKKAYDNLVDLEDKYKYFRMDHSGAYLAMKFFYPDMKVPELVEYVQDHDIWIKKKEYCKEYEAMYQTMPFDFDIWAEWFYDDEKWLNTLRTEGAVLLKSSNIQISNAVSHSVSKFMLINKQYYFVSHVNTINYKSEIANKMLLHHPNSNFSVAYSINDWTEGTSFSLRSMDDRTDVNDVAKRINVSSGGHSNAAGHASTYVTSNLPGKVLDNNTLYKKLNNIYFSSINVYATINDKIGDELKEYNIVYMNLSNCKSDMAKYLLQNRNDKYQECINIQLNKLNRELQDITKFTSENSNSIQDYLTQVGENNTKYIENFYYNNLALNKEITLDDYTLSLNNQIQTVQNTKVSISAIWDYDGSQNKTWFSIYIHSNINAKERADLEKYFNGEKNQDMIYASRDGLVSTITI